MAIIVEDGTGLTTANSYISAAELTTYATDRGLTIAGTAEALLYQSMDYIEQQPFAGTKQSDEQSLQWPRYGVYIDSYYVLETTIPQLLKDAQAEFAIGIDAGNNPLATEDRAVKREKVGEVEREYMDSARNKTYLTAAEYKLRKLLGISGNGINVRVSRG